MHVCVCVCVRERGREGAPLRDDDAAFPPLDAAPHPPALLEVLGARVDRVERRGFGLAPVGDEAPPHGLHDERGLLRSRATDDGRVCARRDVVPRHVAISVHPLIDAERGVAVQLFDFVRLVCFFLEKRKLRIVKRGADCAHLKCECESAAHVKLNRGQSSFGSEVQIMGRHGGPVVPRLYWVRCQCIYTQSESVNPVLYLHDCQGEMGSVHLENGRNKGGEERDPYSYNYHIRPQRSRSDSMRGRG